MCVVVSVVFHEWCCIDDAYISDVVYMPFNMCCCICVVVCMLLYTFWFIHAFVYMVDNTGDCICYVV